MEEGPKKTVSHSCFNCKYCESTSYNVQGDSGHDVYCNHNDKDNPDYIGDTNWNTPKWCPFLKESKVKTVLKFSKTVINEALSSENSITFGDIGAWKDCLNEIDEVLEDETI